MDGFEANGGRKVCVWVLVVNDEQRRRKTSLLVVEEHNQGW